MIKVSVLYPNTTGCKFDMSYYVDKHMPMVQNKLGPACKRVAVLRAARLGHPQLTLRWAISISIQPTPFKLRLPRMRRPSLPTSPTTPILSRLFRSARLSCDDRWSEWLWAIVTFGHLPGVLLRVAQRC